MEEKMDADHNYAQLRTLQPLFRDTAYNRHKHIYFLSHNPNTTDTGL